MSTLASDLGIESAATMIVLPGQRALSEFRLAKLLQILQGHDARIQSVNASYTYFASVGSPVASETRDGLESLLVDGESVDVLSSGVQAIIAVPRPGTISPWSSKATDIAHSCGLGSVERIERGIRYELTTTTTLDDGELETAGKLLIDRLEKVNAPRIVIHDVGETGPHYEQGPPICHKSGDGNPFLLAVTN